MDIIGHQAIWNFLTAAADAGQGAHAYLFVGPRHIGKGFVAQEFAKHRLCHADPNSGAASLFGGTAQPTKRPCGHCDSCQALEKNIHPDLITLKREEEEHTISIEQTRTFLSRLRQSPSLSSRKIAIVDEAEYMTTAAANAFLKQLEEPTPSTCLVLIVHNRQRLLPTIASRCQVIEFDRVQSKPADAAAPLWQQADGLPGLYMQYKQSPSMAQQQQDEEQGIFNLFDMTGGQRLAYLDSFFTKKKGAHAEQKQTWDLRLRAWQRGLRKAALNQQASDGKRVSYNTYLSVSNELDDLRRGLDKNINIRSHLERFCLRLGPPSAH